MKIIDGLKAHEIIIQIAGSNPADGLYGISNYGRLFSFSFTARKWVLMCKGILEGGDDE